MDDISDRYQVPPCTPHLDQGVDAPPSTPNSVTRLDDTPKIASQETMPDATAPIRVAVSPQQLQSLGVDKLKELKEKFVAAGADPSKLDGFSVSATERSNPPGKIEYVFHPPLGKQFRSMIEVAAAFGVKVCSGFCFTGSNTIVYEHKQTQTCTHELCVLATGMSESIRMHAYRTPCAVLLFTADVSVRLDQKILIFIT